MRDYIHGMRAALAAAVFTTLVGCNQAGADHSDRKTDEQAKHERAEKTRERAADLTERAKPALEKAGRKLDEGARAAAEQARAAAQGVREGWNRKASHVADL